MSREQGGGINYSKKDPLRTEKHNDSMGELKVTHTYGCDCSAGYGLMKTEQ